MFFASNLHSFILSLVSSLIYSFLTTFVHHVQVNDRRGSGYRCLGLLKNLFCPLFSFNKSSGQNVYLYSGMISKEAQGMKLPF